MHLKNFLGKLGALKATNRLLMVMIGILIFIALLNHFDLQKAMSSHTTILVPTGLDRKVTITGNHLDEYLAIKTVRYICGLAFNYHPGNVKAQFEELLLLYAPESYESAKITWANLKDKVLTTQITSTFWMNPKIQIDEANGKIVVKGLQRHGREDIKAQEIQKTYVIEYQVTDGFFAVKSIYESERPGEVNR